MASFDLSALYILNGLPQEVHAAADIISMSVYAIMALAIYVNLKESRTRGAKAAISIAVAFAASLLIKQITQVPRPYRSVDGLVVTHNSERTSFPSSHTALAFAASETKPAYVNIFRIWAALIGISRIVLAQHYLTDVVAGAALGALASWAVTRWDSKEFLARLKKNRLEIKRQAMHMIVGIAIAYIILFLEKTQAIALFAAITATGYAISRLAKKRRIPVIDWFLDHFERKKDSKKFPGKGALFFNLGAALSILLYGNDIAFAAVLVLAVGDSATTACGKLFGVTRHIYNRGKTLEGSLFGMAAAFLALLFLTPANAFDSFVVAIAFGIAESFTLRIGQLEIDDNLVIPVVCGLVLALI